MTLHQGSIELLAAVPEAFPGAAVRILATDGAVVAAYGHEQGDCLEVAGEWPCGRLVARVPAAAAPVLALIDALVQSVAERERLEGDMESMNASALRLLEQVSMIGETLPRLSAGGDDAEIASLGARACRRATGVRHVIYLGWHPGKDCCEIVVHLTADGVQPTAAGNIAADEVQPAGGFAAEVLAAGGILFRSVPSGERLGDRGSVEHLAERQVLGVPVTYGAGDKQVTLGALILIDRVEAFEGAESDVEAPVLGSEEGQMAESFAAMLGAVLGARKVAALGKELSMAQTIQRQILPEHDLRLSGFDIAARYHACGAVGGDYFDYVQLADGRIMVVIADVSGHNLASGMVMVSARATLRTLARSQSAPDAVFRSLAELMHADLVRTERFLTAAAVTLRPGASGIDYVSAGHNALLVYRARRDQVESLPSESTILGFLPEADYSAIPVEVEPGDCLLLYTDGVTETADENGVMFGEERLAAVFAQLAPNRSAQRIVDGLIAELESFRRGRIADDDVTAVVLRCVAAGGWR